MTLPESAVPPGYPRSCEGDVELADGRLVHLRPVVPQDVHELARAIARSDPDTALAAFDQQGTGVGIARLAG